MAVPPGVGTGPQNDPRGYWGSTDPQGRTQDDPYFGMPAYPDYNPLYTPGMALAPGYETQLAGINPDPRGLDKFRTEALRTGPSAWAMLAKQQQYGEEANAREQGARQVAGQTATANSALAAHGGLNSGARERVAEGGARNFLDMSQNVGRQGNLNRMQIGMNDEQNRISQLGQLPGMENQAATFQMGKAEQGFNARAKDQSNQLQENKNLNDFNMGRYQTQGQIWGAGKQADATAKANSGGGSWLCTEANVDAHDKIWLKRLRNYSYREAPEMTRFYIYECAPLVSRMRLKNADWNENKKFVAHAIALTREGKMREAFEFYKNHTLELIAKFWPDCSNPIYVESMGVT